MSIFYCNACGFLSEFGEDQVNQKIPCPKCATPGRVHPTLTFVDTVVKRYLNALREIKRLQNVTAAPEAPPIPVPVPKKPKTQTAANSPSPNIDLHNTSFFATASQHAPIIEYFRQRNCSVQISPESVDTSGYFDEIGVEIAENFPLYRRVLGGIRWAQQEKRSSCKIYLEKYSEADAQMLIAFCQRLYDTTFISRCLHSREENSLRLQVQDAKNIQHFFDGGWLEWHALMMILKSAQQRGLPFACARNLIVNFSPNEKCELDVFALVGGTPICIEAKSGEYRSFIEKMRYLRKKLGCSQERCIFCIAGLETEKLAALSAMHQLAFTNEKTIAEHLQNVLQDIKILK